MAALQAVDSPQGLAFDPTDGAVYVTQARRHTVARMYVNDTNCLVGGGQC